MEPEYAESRPQGLPSKYEFVRVEGQGSFGQVVRCIDMETLQIVAIKMPFRRDNDSKNELSILKTNMRHNLDKCNIVKYIECFKTKHGKALVFETLDISLYQYMQQNQFAPMPLSDIRTIIQQMATAFDALKGIRVIHSDVKLDNIMIVNQCRQPFEVKLIDFGIATSTSQAKKFRGRQIAQITSPEVSLGGKFNEAIDMWALGCTMFQMICGSLPFRGTCDDNVILSIIELLGKPADHSLEKLPKAKLFFTKTDGVWSIKPLETLKLRLATIKKGHEFQSLDEMKAMRLEKDNPTEAVEREQCIELLKAMLAFDADERITPSEVLAHPFITKVYPSVQTVSEDFECEPPAAPLDDEAGSIIQPGDCPPSPEILPSGVILVRPVTAKDTTLLEDQKSTVSEPTAAPLRDEAGSNIQPDDCTPSPEILPSGAILVRPLTAEDTTLLEDQESTVSEPTAAPLRDEAGSNIEPDDCTPSPEILPSGAILVRPLTAEDTTLLEDQESTVSEPTAAPLRDEAGSNIQPDDCTPSTEILPSGVILVRPHSSAENSMLLEHQEIPVSFQSGLNKTSESAVINADSNRKTSDDSTACEDTGPKKNGKKKKNCFRRVVSWWRKTFSCCVSCVNED